ncbi:MAG: VWA domain-containing protein [Kiloniellales bacterium]|nr:VWA domain-containing protein [Kiloniellales bacterium]
MDERQLKEMLSTQAIPPAEENARKEAINLARAAFDRAQSEAKQSRQGTGLLGRLMGRDQKRSKGRPMALKRIYWGLGGGTTAMLVLVSVTAVILFSEVSDKEPLNSRLTSVTVPQAPPPRSVATPNVAAPLADPPVAAKREPKAAEAPAAATSVRRQPLGASVPPQGYARIDPAPIDQPQQRYQDVGRDQFESVAENPVRRVAEDPVSAFSIDVDTASYAFVRRELNRGVLPQKDAVRIEELINYFDYAYPLPAERTRPFAPSVTVTPSPWKAGNKLIHIGIKGYDLDPAEKPRSNLVFLLDVSGSMNAPDKLPLMVNSMKLLLDGLAPEDTVAIVTYAGNAGTVLEPTAVAERHKILGALDRLRSRGSTAGAEGIRQAYALAESGFDPEAVNRVILATDGDFNVGITDREELKGFIERKRESGVFLSVLGFGQGNLNDHLMQTLAQNGNGVAAHIDTLNEARKVLVEEAAAALFPIAKDVKIQVEFNSRTVAEYRLIGYETRALKREDFANDRVDAGDIGAGHTVTVIYEITPVGSGNELIAPSRYQGESPARETQFAEEYAFLKIRYKLPDQDTSSLITTPITIDLESELDAPDTRAREARFATAVAGFGQLLKGGTYTGSFGYDEVIALAQGARGEDPFGYRAEFLNLVRLARSAAALPRD